MRLSSCLNLGLIALGAAASIKTLQHRHHWEQSNRRAYIVFDYDDALAVSIRAGMPLAELLHEAHHHGATHLSLPELTLERLMRAGRLVPVIPGRPLVEPARVGQWVYLASAEPDLLDTLVAELRARIPSCNAHLLPHPPAPAYAHTPTLAFSGDLPTLAEMGLGFESRLAAEALLSGLSLVPRPVSFSWPEDHLVERTLAQAAGLGADIVAFDGDLILGHEMHLDTTVACLERFGLNFAYFCETRHQKGDWFIAKRLAPKRQVILAHALTPAALAAEDYHSAAHHWGMLARARGIRLCYLNVFRRIHATDPLECLHYMEHVKQTLQEIGLAFDEGCPQFASPPDRGALALTGLACAGAVSLAATEVLGVTEPFALALSAASVAGAASLPYLDRPHGPLEESYPPSYASKLLALAGASAAPLAASALDDGDPLLAMVGGVLVQAGTAASLAAMTTGQEYQQRIEEYRSSNVDLLLPLAGSLLRDLGDRKSRGLALAALCAGWLASRKLSPDLLGALDRDLPAGHTHHLSAAQRFIGDALRALGPRPGRKWAGLGLAGLSSASAFRKMKRRDFALAAALVGAVGNALMLAAFRRPERPLAQTLPGVGKSWAWGAALGLLASLLKLVHDFRYAD